MCEAYIRFPTWRSVSITEEPAGGSVLPALPACPYEAEECQQKEDWQLGKELENLARQLHTQVQENEKLRTRGRRNS
jgi:hypothetical protein